MTTPLFVESLAGALFRHAWPVYRPLYFAFKRWQDATEIALLPYVLRHGTRAFPSLRAVNRRLEELYGATLAVDVLKLGEEQVITLRLEVVGDAFLPPGEGVLRRCGDGRDHREEAAPRPGPQGSTTSAQDADKRGYVTPVPQLWPSTARPSGRRSPW